MCCSADKNVLIKNTFQNIKHTLTAISGKPNWHLIFNLSQHQNSTLTLIWSYQIHSTVNCTGDKESKSTLGHIKYFVILVYL